MSHAHTLPQSAAALLPSPSLRAALRRLLGRLRRESRLRRTIRELSALDERTLHDLGLTRGEIETFVRHGAEALLPWSGGDARRSRI